MKRYTCEDCKQIKRASWKDRVRCRKCINKLVKGEGNRPNRKPNN
jgi:DNA-directed RNA polymerase subunit RPC12/RpoP